MRIKTSRFPVRNADRWVAWILVVFWAGPALSAGCDTSWESLVGLAADRIDAVFEGVAASTRALGAEYGALAARLLAVTDQDQVAWARRARSSGATTGFRTWPEGAPTPAFQAAFPGFYSYRGEPLTSDGIARLQAFERLVPAFRAAYRSFGFSWVYLTTADDMMLIYPYLPMEEAVNNDRPTDQIYYKAADFERRSVGWTLPYLDLVGAGMMITASFPVYGGDRLLGVASRDITIEQLSRSVLSHLAQAGGASALLVDKRGLAIDASDPALAAELQTVNKAKKAAVLFYRTPDGLGGLDDRGAVASRFGWANQLTERVLAAAGRPNASGPIALEVEGRRAMAARIESTGWFVILVIGDAS